jgi:hypothetical protein
MTQPAPKRETFTSLRATRTAHQVAREVLNPHMELPEFQKPVVSPHKVLWPIEHPTDYKPEEQLVLPVFDPGPSKVRESRDGFNLSWTWRDSITVGAFVMVLMSLTCMLILVFI